MLPGRTSMRVRVVLQLVLALHAPGFAAAAPFSFAPLFDDLGALSGSLQAGAAPADVALKVSREAGSGTGPSVVELACAVREGRFACLVPAGRLDIRLISPGFAPVYFWGIEVESLQTAEIGRVSLHTGSSLSGWVLVPDKSLPLSEVAVELLPEVNGWQGDPAERKRTEIRGHRGPVGPNGFFQLTGLSPGDYVLTAQLEGLSPARVPLTIPEGGEVALPAPLRLEPLTPLQVWLSPATHLDGTPWQVELYALVPKTNVYEKVVRSAAGLDGGWVSKPLRAGIYEVLVSDSAGSDLFRTVHQVDSSTPPLMIELDLVPVKGTLSMGGEPRSGTVVFGTTNRKPNVRLDTDEEGRFAGYLPKPGTWPVEVVLAEDRKQRAADVEIDRLSSGEPDVADVELPRTRIAGRVVAGGAPVSEAFVVITSTAGGRRQREASLRVDREGAFEALGLSAGRLAVRAYDRTRTSKWVDIDLTEGTDISELQLNLGESLEVQGRLLGPHGPAAGGSVVAWAELPDAAPISIAEVVSAADGTFRLNVDARAAALKVVTVIPGCGVEIGRFAVPGEPGQILAISCSAGKGEVLLRGAEGLVFHRGAGIETRALFSILDRAGLLAWSDEGPVLRSMPGGAYRFCTTGNCQDGELAPGAQLTFAPR